MAPRHNAAREGLIAGVLGATSVALWFLILDVLAGRPQRLPALGRAARPRRRPKPGQVRPSLQWSLDAITAGPAYGISPRKSCAGSPCRAIR